MTTAIQTAVARAPDVEDIEWVRQHFLHHNGSSYFVIPNLYSIPQDESPESKREELRALAMNQLAGVFDDLKVVLALTPAELQKFGVDETRDSYTDLSAYRRDNDEALSHGPSPVQGGLKGIFSRKTAAVPADAPTGQRMRNHGLLSKAQRTLDIAGWSKGAQSDVEIFRLVDTEGLTPLLSVLNDAQLERSDPIAVAPAKV